MARSQQGGLPCCSCTAFWIEWHTKALPAMVAVSRGSAPLQLQCSPEEARSERSPPAAPLLPLPARTMTEPGPLKSCTAACFQQPAAAQDQGV